MSMAFVQPQLSKLFEVEMEVGYENKDDVKLYSKFWLVVLSPRLSESAAENASTAG